MKSHTLKEYVDLIEVFVDRTITATTFERQYLRMFKEEPAIRPESEYRILNRLFSDVDVFSADPKLRAPDGLDEEGLLSSARAALYALRALDRTA